jgi:hypothetical protein
MKNFLKKLKIYAGLMLVLLVLASGVLPAPSAIQSIITPQASAACPAGQISWNTSQCVHGYPQCTGPTSTNPPGFTCDPTTSCPGGITYVGQSFAYPCLDTENKLTGPVGTPTDGNGGTREPCPGTNAPPGTDCSTIPPGCPGGPNGPLPPHDQDLNCTYYIDDANNPGWTCPQVKCNFNNGQYVEYGKSELITPHPEDQPPEDPDLDCGTTKTGLDWIICPVVRLTNLVLSGLDNIIITMLTVEPKVVDETNASNPGYNYYKAWGVFRNIALGLIVIIALIMLISQALSFDIFDAYTIKKVMPRLVIAIIGTALSWQLMKWFVIFTNDLGLGVRSIILLPFQQVGGGQIDLAASLILTLLGAPLILGFGIIGLLLFGGTALLALVIAFLVLIARQLVIVVLLISAPLAIAAYVLPNTQSVWKLWHESFTKALLMFPIIMAFIAVGKAFAVTSSTDSSSVVGQLIAFVAYIMPYFLLPLAFRFAGGAMRTIGGFANDRSRGAFDRLKKGRQKAFAENGGRRIEAGNRRVLQKRAAWADSLKTSASKDGASWVRRKALGGLAGGIGGYNVEAVMSSKRAHVAKELNDQIATGRDEEIRGLTVDRKNAARRIGDNGQVQRQTLGGAWVDQAHVDAAYKRWGNDTFAQQTALSYEMRKASSESELEGITKNYGALAKGGWKMTDGEAGGAWTGAAFENQGANLSLKKTNWKDGSMSTNQQLDFVNEVYEKKGSYPLAQMSSFQIEKLKEAHTSAQARGDVNTQERIRAIAETFMHEAGTAGGGYAPVGGPDQAPQPVGAPDAVNRTRQANTPGAAHVAERVRELAVQTGAYAAAPSGTYGPQTSGPNAGDPHAISPNEQAQK